MPLIGAEQQFILFIQHHYLDGGGADIDSYAQTHDFETPTIDWISFYFFSIMIAILGSKNNGINDFLTGQRGGKTGI
ncbi:hypothetical protein I4100191B2_06390 [Clostridiales bacterium]